MYKSKKNLTFARLL
ncbi:MAG: hypothetical protein KBS42_00010 [Bacteroidales bacterium]|nr:hypothetical protein [Candidatus Colicola coprequi]